MYLEKTMETCILKVIYFERSDLLIIMFEFCTEAELLL